MSGAPIFATRAAGLRQSFRLPDSARDRIRAFMPLSIAALMSMVVGLSIVRGSASSAILIAACLGVAMVPFFVSLGFRALPIWAVVTPVAYPFLRYPPGRALVSFDRVWILAMLVVVLLQVSQRSQAKESKLLSRALVWLVLSYGLRALLTSGDRTTGVEIWIEAILLPAALFMIVRRWAADTWHVSAILGGLMVGGVVIATIGIAEHFLGFQLASFSGSVVDYDRVIDMVRVSGPYSAPEPFALALVSCLAATLTWVQLRGRAAYLIGGSAASIQLVGIFLTYFRAAWIAAMIVVIASVAIRPRRPVRSVVTALVVGFCLYAAFSQLENSSTVSTRVSGTIAGQNVSGRFATYQEGLQVFGSAPLFGVGVGQYAAATIDRAQSVEVGGVGALADPHSSFVGLLAEQGIVGFLPLVAVVVAIYLLLRRLGKRARARDEVLLYPALAGASLGYLVMSLTLTMLPFGPSNAFYAVLLGLAAARLSAATVRDGTEAESPGSDGVARQPGAASRTTAALA